MRGIVKVVEKATGFFNNLLEKLEPAPQPTVSGWLWGQVGKPLLTPLIVQFLPTSHRPAQVRYDDTATYNQPNRTAFLKLEFGYFFLVAADGVVEDAIITTQHQTSH